MAVTDPIPEKYILLLRLAGEMALEGTCNKARVGAVFMSANAPILYMGANQCYEGGVDCREGGCNEEEGHCTNAQHAELDALDAAWDAEGDWEEGTLFVSYEVMVPHEHDDFNPDVPHVCPQHAQLLKDGGIKDVFVRKVDEHGEEFWSFRDQSW
jgi:hypothetical protein